MSESRIVQNIFELLKQAQETTDVVLTIEERPTIVEMEGTDTPENCWEGIGEQTGGFQRLQDWVEFHWNPDDGKQAPGGTVATADRWGRSGEAQLDAVTARDETERPHLWRGCGGWLPRALAGRRGPRGLPCPGGYRWRPPRTGRPTGASCHSPAPVRLAVTRVPGPIKGSSQSLRDAGNADDSLLPHLSPLGWEHINLTGDYNWRQNKQVGQGDFRPGSPPLNWP